MPTFDELLEQVRTLLQRDGRVAYRVLKRRFALGDDDLEDLKADLIDAKRVAVDEEGKVLVWTGTTPVSGSTLQVSGSHLPDPQRQTLAPRREAGERRQLTVMFCDLVDSTAWSEQLDPEEWRVLVKEYQGVCAEIIRRFDGHIAQYLGDGVLVYFGHPVAHEDDAQRAARSGLEIVAELQQRNGRVESAVGVQHVAPLQVRVGIHTGLVVVGEIGEGSRREQLALGDTPNIAARLQGLAQPNTVVISAATHRLIAGLLDCQDLGPHSLKGVSTPIQLYQLVGESGARSRLDVAVITGLTPLVGREEEVGLLFKRWEHAKAGDGQVVMLNGEAGIGKSRLVQVLKEHLTPEVHARVECRCSPYYQNSALYPVIDHLQRLLEFQREDSAEEKLRKLEVGARLRPGSSTGHVPLQPEAIPLFASLLSIPLPTHYPLLTGTPQRQKQKTLEALLVWLLKEAERQPVLMVMEDLHWVDPSTQEFLSLLIDQVSTARLLIVLTFRPDFSPPWAMLSHMMQLTLNRLGRKQVEAMVGKIAGGKALPAEVLQQMVAKTDGVPLFVEELTKTVLESGLDVGATSGSSLPLTIPVTLHDSLMARLDRMNMAKEVAQLGATIGREFTYELIQSVSSVDEKTLQSALVKLVEAELLYQRGLPPQARYIFKHALIQDAAYQSLLKSTRQQYHQQIAHVLEKFTETEETQPELLAHHYTEAGLATQAIPYWQQAGQKAIERSANAEAIGHLTKGLEVLKTLPDTPERTRQELSLQIALGVPLTATKGYAASEVEKAYARARELCQQAGEALQLFPALHGLLRFYLVRAELQTAHELGEQLLRLAQSAQDPALLVEARAVLGGTSLCLGELALAREYLEGGIALYDSQQYRSHAFLYGNDPGVFCRRYAAWVLWSLGYPDQALKRSYEALTLAQELSHPLNLASAMVFAAWLHQYRLEGQLTQEQAEAAITLSTDQGLTYWLAMGIILRGWALAEQGQQEKGVAQMRQGLAAQQATGAEVGQPYLFALLAEAYGKVGQVTEGLSVLAGALAAMDKSGERFWEAELYRLKGTLTLQKFQVSGFRFQVLNPQPEAEAEACFHKAIEIAQKQQAKSLELRAVMSLTRLWRHQGKKAEARQMLAEIYGWFTEGFDTKDLQEAKALLEALV